MVDHQKISQIKDDAVHRNSEGTSARTRPFSFEEILLERKNKKVAYIFEKEPYDTRESEKNDLNRDHKQPASNNVYKITRDLKDAGERESRIKGEIVICKNENSTRHENNVKKKLNADMEFKHGRDVINGEKKSNIDIRSHCRSRFKSINEGLKVEFDKESRKKRTKDIIANDKNTERDKRSKREEKGVHQSENKSKNRYEVESSSRKKRNHLFDFEYLDKGRKHDLKRSNTRRSRSRERYQRRGHYNSVSPRPQKRSYPSESPSHLKDNSGSQYSNPDSQRASRTDGYDNQLHRKRGSRLGGYSPRKRITRTNARSPSPSVQSPDKKVTTWDQHPSTSIPTSVQLANTYSFSSSLTIKNTVNDQSVISIPQKTSDMMLNASADTFQLTQATRPIRRLYIENIPPSSSEKAVTEWLNNKLASSVGNHVQRTPCISCIINKEKCQAVVEFLTPDDATSALCFNGKSFAGSVLKIRRPRDFIDTTTEVREKLFTAVDGIQRHHSTSEVYEISDVVMDSPHKIFIGGISKFLSPDMLMNIVSVFGSLKAYHFEVNEKLNEPCAYLEYMDKSVTVNAIIGLNGMKLGGRFLTVVKALPDCQSDEGKGVNHATYIVPEHARPLLESPTQILKLDNVFNPEKFTLHSESELEEILEDVRHECARFGTIKSINIVRCRDVTSRDSYHIKSNYTGKGEMPIIDSRFCGEIMFQNDPPSIDDVSQKPSSDPENYYMENVEEGKESCTISDVNHCIEDEDVKITSRHGDSGTVNSEGIPEDSILEKMQIQMKNEHMEMTVITDKSVDHVDVFEPGSILVEFLREEATSMAAHCLHGRLFDGRIVSACYAAYDAFLAKFPR